MSNAEIQANLDSILYQPVHNSNGVYDFKIKKLRIEQVQKELVSSKMQLFSKDKLLTEVKDFLSSLVNNSPIDEKKHKEVSVLISKIENNKEEREWREFEKHFDFLHSGFFKKLKISYPSLSVAEVKLCGLIKMKLTTKEMASYLSLSLRGIESQRYRLRKKMKISNGITLEQLLDSI